MSSRLAILVALISLAAAPWEACGAKPTTPESHNHGPGVTIKNGTLQGYYLPGFHEDLFLGVPFASPPIGDLRLQHPVPYKEHWQGVRDATLKSPSCPGYAGFDERLVLGEDCLTVDVVRPAGTSYRDKLPVLVWIYGGVFDAGGSADPRYNTSYLHQPPRGGWGFLVSKEVAAAGQLNTGLYDQRLALQENIAAFGGDPAKVTIAGESAGGFGVGYHLTAFDGKNDGLFRAAILQSGNAMGPGINSVAQLNATYQPIYNDVTETVRCSNTRDTQACLCTVPYAELFSAFAPFVITPVLDGQFLSQLPSESFAAGLVTDVAILAGSNTDEGTATFSGPRGTLETDVDVHSLLAGMGTGLDNKTVVEAMALYPDDPSLGCPFGTGSERFAHLGYMYKRGAAIVGDEVIHAGRRLTTEFYSSRSSSCLKLVYSYRFNQSPWNGVEVLVATEAPVYATHYSEICFVFNISPSASISNTNWIGPYKSYYELSNLISRSWISFVHDLDPNHYGIRQAPFWPDYSQGHKNVVFAVRNTTIEPDTWRSEHFKFWMRNFGILKT